MSAAYWQTSRIYAILGQAENARRYGQLCPDTSLGEDVPTFFRGYAYEALARVESIAGNKEQMKTYLNDARQVADRIPKPDPRKALLDDLSTIK
jgi:hypothetical protein